MDSGKKPGKSVVGNSKENWSHQKKSGASYSDQESSGVIRLEERRSHRKTERFTEAMAELVQSMTTAWDDTKGVREIRANHRSVTGWVAGQNAHGPIPFESTLERDFVYLALFEPAISRLQSQPMTLTYQDSTGSSRYYTPDFLIEYGFPGAGTRKAIIEIKFTDDLEANRDRLEPGFRAMRAWCETNGHSFYIVTDSIIRTVRIENVKAVFPFRYDKDADHRVSDDVFELICRKAPLLIGEILAEANHDAERRAAMQSAIWGLLAIGMIWIDLDEPLGPNSLVHLTPPQDHSLFFTKVE